MTNEMINNEIIPAETTTAAIPAMEEMLQQDIIIPDVPVPMVEETPVVQDIPMPTDADVPVAPAVAPVRTYTAEETAAWKKERDGRINACIRGGQKLYVCSFVSGKSKKSIAVAKSSNGKEVTISDIAAGFNGSQAAHAIWAVGQSINWLYGMLKADKYSLDKDTLLILGTNNNAAAIYIQKALFSGTINFSKSCSLDQKNRQYVAESSLKIAGIINSMKEQYGCEIAVEALDRNVITSNGHSASDLFALRESIATFGDVDVKGTKYQMASVPITLENGTKRSFNFFTKFRPTFQGAKGVIRSYKAKNGNTPVEFYIESPYRATIWSLYNGVKEKINN